MAPQFDHGAMRHSLESQLCAELELERIEGVARCAEAQDWVGPGGTGENGVSVERVQVFDVSAIEQVEHIAAQFCAKTFFQLKCPSDAEVEAGVTRPLERIASQIARAIGEGIAVAVGVRARKNIEGL